VESQYRIYIVPVTSKGAALEDVVRSFEEDVQSGRVGGSYRSLILIEGFGPTMHFYVC